MQIEFAERPRAFVIAVLVLLLLYGFGIGYVAVSVTRAQNRLDLTEARQQAQEAAAHQAEVTVCRRNVAQAPTTAAILSSLGDLIQARVDSSRASLDADPDSALDDVRRHAIEQGLDALDAIDAIAIELARTTPTKAKCDRLAVRYGIKPAPREKEVEQ